MAVHYKKPLTVFTQRNVIEWFHQNRAYSAFRVYTAIRMFCSGHLPASTVGNKKLEHLLLNLNMSYSAYRKQIRFLCEAGLVERGRKDYHIIGQRRFNARTEESAIRRRRIECPSSAIKTLDQFTAWVYAAQMTEDIKYLQKQKFSSSHTDQLAKSGWAGRLTRFLREEERNVKSLICDYYAASIFEKFLDRDRSTISKWRSKAAKYGYLRVVHDRRSPYVKNKQDSFLMRDHLHSLGLCSRNAKIYYRSKDSANWEYYMNIDLPAKMYTSLKVKRSLGRTPKKAKVLAQVLSGRERVQAKELMTL